MVKNLPSDAGDVQLLIPGWGAKIPRAVEQLRPLAATIASPHPQLENPRTTTTTKKKSQMMPKKKKKKSQMTRLKSQGSQGRPDAAK